MLFTFNKNRKMELKDDDMYTQPQIVLVLASDEEDEGESDVLKSDETSYYSPRYDEADVTVQPLQFDVSCETEPDMFRDGEFIQDLDNIGAEMETTFEQGSKCVTPDRFTENGLDRALPPIRTVHFDNASNGNVQLSYLEASGTAPNKPVYKLTPVRLVKQFEFGEDLRKRQQAKFASVKSPVAQYIKYNVPIHQAPKSEEKRTKRARKERNTQLKFGVVAERMCLCSTRKDGAALEKFPADTLLTDLSEIK